MRLRAEYLSGPDLKFLSALDRMRLMERSLRRAEIPFALSVGFNPHIKLSMGTVLPVGLWGGKEYMDVELSQAIKPGEFMDRLNHSLPKGMQINQAVVLTGSQPALMKIINACAYEMAWQSQRVSLEPVIAEIMSKPQLIVRSRGKKKNQEKDLRKGIYKVEWEAEGAIEYIRIWVSVGEPLNIRYDELIDLFSEFGVPPERLLDINRAGNYIYQNGDFISPITQT